jgi:hypothetical protein
MARVSQRPRFGDSPIMLMEYIHSGPPSMHHHRELVVIDDDDDAPLLERSVNPEVSDNDDDAPLMERSVSPEVSEDKDDDDTPLLLPSREQKDQGVNEFTKTLDSQGWLAVDIHNTNTFQTSSFVNELTVAAHQRFIDYLDDDILERHGAQAFTFPQSMAVLYTAKLRKIKFGEVDAKRIRWALNGGQNLALANLYRAWTKNGFGFPAHLRSFGVLYTDILPVTKVVLDSISGKNNQPTTLSHLIWRVPHVKKDGTLACHTDRYTPKQMYDIHARQCHSTKEWVDKCGTQKLVHLTGGHSCGQTHVLSPMTPNRLFIILCLMHPNHTHPGLVRYNSAKMWSQSGSGPSFFQYDNKKNLAVFNRLIGFFERLRPLEKGKAIEIKDVNPNLLNNIDRTWYQQLTATDLDVILLKKMMDPKVHAPVKYVPMVTVDADTATLVIWPVGFPHGAAGNIKQRITFTIEMDHIIDEATVQRGEAWLSNIAHERWNQLDDVPFQGGGTHKKPQKEADLHPYFGHLFIKPESLPALSL